ncbi:MAG TPA: FAD:protein FMN transferase [Polyangiaceae bacterium]|nr:FAD:protein FMN transferase [Polyangiaceae bacterium]
MRSGFVALSVLVALSACQRNDPHADARSPEPSVSAPPAVASAIPEPVPAPSAKPAFPPRIDFSEPAMGTEVHFVSFPQEGLDETAVRAAMQKAHAEIVRVENLMTSWRDTSEIGQVNLGAGKQPVKVSPETFEVLKKSVWAGQISEGVFDISFHALGDLWKFGDAQEAHPKLPDPKVVAEKRKLVDYRKMKLDEKALTVSLPAKMRIDLGGIAKGYAVDKAAAVLKAAGLVNFLAQAGGDLYGAGHKPDGSPWVSGIQDPRGQHGEFFATIELPDHAFSTAGDYARAFFVDGKRYHHIIDPRTGYPATACRSVTIWAGDAFTADAVDDAVFILGPEKGLKLVESLPDVGAVIVDAENKVWVSHRLEGKVHVLHPPTDGP